MNTTSTTSTASSFDILVLGTKGVGKTTLLTVLGMKFERMGAFGLSMVPCDRETQLFVRNAAWSMRVNHVFPAATDRTDARPLSWNVLAGTEPLFRLSSLDCAGETLSQVFCAAHPDSEDIDEGDDMRITKEALSNLANRATAVCLVLEPGQLPGNRSLRDNSDPDIAARMNEVDDLISAVAHSPKFEGKGLVVALTRTDDFTVHEEIVKNGGPRGYLRAKCPKFTNSKRFDNAHVVALAPVVAAPSNKRTDDSPVTFVPDNFQSSGLEDFLIALGGSVPSSLVPLAESCRSLLKAEWHDAQMLRSGGAADRLAAARQRADAAAVFQKAAIGFCDLGEMDAVVRTATETRILQSVSAAQVRLAVEEAVSRTLIHRWSPSKGPALLAALVKAAKSAAQSVPDAPPAKDGDFFLSSSVWAERQRAELPRNRRGLEAAVRAAIASKDRIAADSRYMELVSIAENPCSSVLNRLRKSIDKIPFPDQLKPLDCQFRIPGKPQGRSLVSGQLVCRNGRLQYLTHFRHVPVWDERNWLYLIPVLFAVPEALCGIAARRRAREWSCDVERIQRIGMTVKWLNCYLEVVAEDGKSVVFAVAKKEGLCPMKSFLNQFGELFPNVPNMGETPK